MENTCIKEQCEMWGLFGEGKCPNFIESWWKENQTGTQKLVADCAPKRTVLMIQELYSRLVGVEKSQESLRNECVWVEAVARVIGKNTGLNIQEYALKRAGIKAEILEELKECKSLSSPELSLKN